MGKLDSKTRSDMMNLLETHYQQALSIVSVEEMCGKSSSVLTPNELMFRKYRLAFCFKLMEKYGILDKIKFSHLPNVENLFWKYEIDEDEYFYNSWNEYPDAEINLFTMIGECYLLDCLEGTEWNIDYLYHITDYEELDSAILNDMKHVVEFHWSSMKSSNNQFQEDVFITDSPKMEKMGFRADDDIECIPACNIVLTNKNIEKVIALCNEEEKFKSWKEYSELERYRKFILFDRYYAGFDEIDMSVSKWKYMNYFLGELYYDEREETGFYQLNYEAVLYLLLADMAATDFLEKLELFEKSKEGGSSEI